MKVKRIIVSVTLPFLIICSLLIWSQFSASNSESSVSVHLPSSTGSADVTYELAVNVFPSQTEMTTYKVKNTAVTTNSVQKLGANFDLVGSVGSIDRNTKLAMLDETNGKVRQFTAWINSGAVEYAILQPEKLYPSTQPHLPSHEEAKSIAIATLQQSSLWPSDARIENTEVVVGGVVQVRNTSAHTDIEAYDAHLLVRVKRTLDSYDVIGPGAKLGVRIGDQGEVIRLIKCWRDVFPYQVAKIKTPIGAYEDLKSGRGSSITPLSCKRVVITEVSLAYWMDAADEIQEIVLPIYVFRGQCFGIDGRLLSTYEGYCEALAK